MFKALSALSVIAVFTCLSTATCIADRLRSTDYVSVEGGIFTYGDEALDEIFGPHADLFGSANWMVAPNLAVLGKLEGILGEGSSGGVDLTHEGLKGGLSLVYLVSPEKGSADPYLLAGGLAMYNRVEGSSGGDTASEDDTDVGYEVGGGIEFDIGAKSFGDVGLLYQSVGDFDSLSPNARFGYALSEKFTGLLAGGYSVDEEDYWVRVGLGVKL